MRRAYGCANYRFASKSCLFDVVGESCSPLARREREQKGAFYDASATEPFGDTVDAHLRARRVLVAARRTGDPDSADDLQDEANAIEEETRTVYARYGRLLTRANRHLQRKLAPLKERRGDVQRAIEAAQESFDPPEMERPEPTVDPGEEADWLYASDRTYLEQITHYKARRNGHGDGAGG